MFLFCRLCDCYIWHFRLRNATDSGEFKHPTSSVYTKITENSSSSTRPSSTQNAADNQVRKFQNVIHLGCIAGCF